MENFDIKKTLLYFIKKSWIIFIITIIVFIGGYFYKKTADNTQKNLYETGSKIYINNTNDALFLNTPNILLSSHVLSNVINEQNLNINSPELSKMITIKSYKDSKSIYIFVSHPSQETSLNIANSLLKFSIQEINNFINLAENTNTDTDNTIILTKPTSSTLVRSNKSGITDYVEFLAYGVIIGIVVVFIIFYFDTKIKDVETIENNFNIKILGKLYKSKKSGESINIIKSNLIKNLDSKKTILLTSFSNKEKINGIANNLANSFISDNKKVLLLNWTPDSNITKKDDINIDKTNNLFLLNILYPSYSESDIKLLIEKLEKDFDYIIITSAPITEENNSIFLSSLIKTIVVVAKIDYTKTTDIENTIKTLRLVNSNISGIIVDNI